MSYIAKHWKGDLPLAVSFWINLFALSLCIRFLDAWLDTAPIEDPVLAARISIGIEVFAICVLYPWQIVGVWRSADRYIEKARRVFWPRIAKGLIVVGLISTAGTISTSIPAYKDLFHIGFGKDEFGKFNVDVIRDGTMLHLEGGLGFGVSRMVGDLLKKNPNVKGLVLDSIGGRIYEGRQLSKLILAYRLDTYTLKGCYSACVTAFISGNRRYVAVGANIGFHGYSSPFKSIDVDLSNEQERDLQVFRQQGIEESFIERIFRANADDLWYPTIDEMQSAGVIQGTVTSADIIAVDYGSEFASMDSTLLEDPAFTAMKQYEPEAYKRFLDAAAEESARGASEVEIATAAGRQMLQVAMRSASRSSDEAVIALAGASMSVMHALENRDPILCVKWLIPGRYGAINLASYLTDGEMNPLLAALGQVIESSHTVRVPPIDVSDAEDLFASAAEQLGDDVEYLQPDHLQGREDYMKTCNAFIKLYGTLLAEDEKRAGNVLRYVYSLAGS